MTGDMNAHDVAVGIEVVGRCGGVMCIMVYLVLLVVWTIVAMLTAYKGLLIPRKQYQSCNLCEMCDQTTP